tara:strand:+ start:4754 stop:4867 length:114 start_codon:yes stop_codon:yes gene_type:complete
MPGTPDGTPEQGKNSQYDQQSNKTPLAFRVPEKCKPL